jgi:Ca2+/Na+ antiporter
MLFAFLVLMLGFAIGARTFTHFVDQKLFSRAEMTKIGTAYFLLMILLLMFISKSRISLWCAIFFPQLIVVAVLIFFVRTRAKRLRDRIRESLLVIHLKMKSGKSFRQSFDEVINESDPFTREKLAEIKSVVVFSQQKLIRTDPFIAEVIIEFIRIDTNSHAGIRRLTVFREKLRIEDDFRRKSGQVLSQIRAQSLIMSGLYVAVGVFIGHQFGWRSNLRLFLVSAILFLSGLVWIWFDGRRMQWKV